MLHHGFGSYAAWPQAKCHLEYYSKDNCNNGLCGRDVLSSGVSWDRRFFPVLSPATGTLGASRVAICGQQWIAVSIKPQRRSTEGMNYWKAQSFSWGVLISTVQLIWCCCVSLLSDRTCNAPARVGRPGCRGGRARHRVTPTSSASQPVGSCLIKLKMRWEITRSKNKPRQFEPTHLKLHLIMEMEIVMRAVACVRACVSECAFVCVCVCLFAAVTSAWGICFVTWLATPGVGIDVSRLAGDQWEMFILQSVARWSDLSFISLEKCCLFTRARCSDAGSDPDTRFSKSVDSGAASGQGH